MMNDLLNSLLDVGASKDWLITANVILSVLLLLWMLRYRRLYQLRDTERRHNDDLIENLSEGIYRSSPDGQQLAANRALVRLNGYDSETEMLAASRTSARNGMSNRTDATSFRKSCAAMARSKTSSRKYSATSRASGSGSPKSARLVYDKRPASRCSTRDRCATSPRRSTVSARKNSSRS